MDNAVLIALNWKTEVAVEQTNPEVQRFLSEERTRFSKNDPIRGLIYNRGVGCLVIVFLLFGWLVLDWKIWLGSLGALVLLAFIFDKLFPPAKWIDVHDAAVATGDKNLREKIEESIRDGIKK